jgi:mono/diheme cytochrome c family protein
MKAKRALLELAVAAAMTVILADFHRDSSAAADVRPSFDRATIARGAQLAAIGNCAVCHTQPGGKAYAGGRPMDTPFGTIYSTNITPDAETGIGAWTQGDFLRAMHDGIDRAGRDLYPAFPYDHFTRVTDDDVTAIYAFMISRDAVHAKAPPNRLMFPMNLRPIVSAWKALFFERGVYRPDPGQSAQWNRGAYLVEGLGHCGACHTPRNVWGAEKKNEHLAGGEAERWHATALDASSPAPSLWTAGQMFAYLRQGWDERHGTAAGPMKPVTHDLSEVPEEDVRAIAAYLMWTMKEPRPRSPERASAADTAPPGEGSVIFEGACASCHGAPSASAPSMRTVPLALTTSLNAPDPRNAIHIVLEGIWPDSGEKGALMPGFEGALSVDQLETLLAYLRTRFTNQPPWPDIAPRLREIIQHKDAQ